MSDDRVTPAARAIKTRNRIAIIYGAGIAAFSAFFGTLTVLYYFLAHLK